jgi:hypothetical protein
MKFSVDKSFRRAGREVLEVSGDETDIDNNNYKISGLLDQDGLFFHAEDSDHGDRYYAHFPNVRKGDVLLGLWIGRDDYKSSIWAPMVLSPVPLSDAKLKQSWASVPAKFPTYIDAASSPIYRKPG